MSDKEHANEHDEAAEQHEEQESGNRSEAYEQARNQFDDLGAEEKAAFLVESFVHTVTEGLREVSDQVSDDFKQACEKAEAEARKYQAAEEEEEVVVEDVDEKAEAHSDEDTAPKKSTKKGSSKSKKSTKKKNSDDADA